MLLRKTVISLWLLSFLACWTASADWIKPPLFTEKGYPVPQPETPPDIPAAHGAHPDYAIEWWYWVGHLEAVENDETFGFQSTVFRLAGEPHSKKAADPGEAVLAEDQMYMSHAALSELTLKRYHHVERLHRSSWQARSAEDRLDLHSAPIRAYEDDSGSRFHMSYRLPGDIEVDLWLTATKPIVAFGERGLSRKGSEPAAVSLYWTYTRLSVDGTITRNGVPTKVKGAAWQDHEISSSQLGSDLTGWDWTAIQLDDGTEVKAYRLRTAEGGSDPWSAVYWIDKSTNVRGVYADSFEWREDGYWTSPDTGLRYPTTVTIIAKDPKTNTERAYTLRPLLDNQEFIGNRPNNPYWEGACEVLSADGHIIGSAYLELAGYGGGLANQLN